MRSKKFNGSRLKETRKEKSYSQTQLGIAINMHPTSYARAEKRGWMDMDYFRATCDVLKLSDDEIIYIKEL